MNISNNRFHAFSKKVINKTILGRQLHSNLPTSRKLDWNSFNWYFRFAYSQVNVSFAHPYFFLMSGTRVSRLLYLTSNEMRLSSNFLKGNRSRREILKSFPRMINLRRSPKPLTLKPSSTGMKKVKRPSAL